MRRRFFNSSNNDVEMDLSKNYLTFTSLEDKNIISFTNTIYYSINNENWNLLNSGKTIIINAGEKIYFKGELTPSTNNGIGTFSISKNCDINGNIMSLLYGDDFEDKINLSDKQYAFYELFKDCLTIIDASKLVLPALILANYCYDGMFYNCSGLTKAPKLPATTLGSYCYNYMFYHCTSLVKAPELPATTLESYCYNYMFRGCTSLTETPKLPSENLANYCYSNMFNGCTGIKIAHRLPAMILKPYCYANMFNGCTGLITAPELPATSLANYCYSYMFRGCSSLTKAPELPATTLAIYCYNQMFSACINLTQSPILPALTLVNYCYSNMFNACTNLMQVIILATNINAYNCMNNWVSGVSAYGYFLKNPSMPTSSIPPGTSGIPNGWYVGDYNMDNLNIENIIQ